MPAGSRPQTAAKTANGSGSKWPTGILALFGMLMLGVGLLMLGVLGYFFAPQIIRIATDQGEVVIKTSDDDVEVQVLQDGEVVKFIDTKTQQSFSLKSGQYSFKAVASDSTEKIEEGNSFTIEPETLTMKRGETVIVSVTMKPKDGADPQIASNIKSKPISRDKPIYEGNTFAQWINILKSNRDYKAQLKAIEACLAIMETEEEQKQILNGVRVFINTVDRIFEPSTFSRPANYGTSNKEKIAGFHELILRVFNSCGGTVVFDFFKSEIESGTALSQQACMNWLKTRSGKAVIFDRYAELTDAIAKNFDKPEVRSIAAYLIPRTLSENGSLPDFRGSALGEKVKEFVLTASPEQRVAIVNLALGIFPDDQQILMAYQKDLSDPKLNKTFFNDSNGEFNAHWEQVRYVLLRFMCDDIADKKYYDAPNTNSKTKQQRAMTAANWLAKTIDGISLTGDQNLLFTKTTSGGYRYNAEPFKTYDYDLTPRLLQRVVDIGSVPDGRKIRQLFLPKLVKLREANVRVFKKDNADHSSVLRKWKTQRLGDLDYVIAVFQGNPPAELPPKSKLKISADLITRCGCRGQIRPEKRTDNQGRTRS